MELIFIFTEILFKILFIHLLEIAEIIRAFGIDTFVNDKVFPVFLRDKGMVAVRAAQGVLFGETVVIRGEACAADLAAKLAGPAVVAVEIRLRRIAGRAAAVFRDVTFCTAGNGPDLLMVFMLEVKDEELPVPIVLVELDSGEFIGFELLVLWGMGIIKSPLPERNISADEI